jgi:hypothetical protein
MSGSSESGSSDRSGGESDREGSAASSNESEMPDTVKRRHIQQFFGAAWIKRGEITINPLHNDSGPASTDGDADDDEEAKKVQNTKSVTEAALGAKFEILFHKMLPRVIYFVFYRNLVNILHAGPAAAATKIKV